MSNTDPTDTQAHDRTRDESQARNRLALAVEVEDMKWLMASKRGRRVVHRLLSQSGVFRLSFHTNALQMAFNEGNRNMGNALFALVTEHCTDRYAELLQEAKT
ncbi:MULTISPECIES: Bbp19 family protein [unclassified Janthinobacterium]|uniref:Bbp19 family protein n=1 Tax=unclassified Janthinobacterium TaxID=2610881 RepID=UPI000348552F|nr:MULTISPECIES: hypothetical protein [unclassified Janthinobacterium]MEC5161715.1 hypothetical protein [Janthinobacterium sp. CG_S6]